MPPLLHLGVQQGFFGNTVGSAIADVQQRCWMVIYIVRRPIISTFLAKSGPAPELVCALGVCMQMEGYEMQIRGFSLVHPSLLGQSDARSQSFHLFWDEFWNCLRHQQHELTRVVILAVQSTSRPPLFRAGKY